MGGAEVISGLFDWLSLFLKPNKVERNQKANKNKKYKIPLQIKVS